MTNEEAINFGEMWLDMNEDAKDSQTYAFFERALEVLKSEPCEDAVSREAVINAFPDIPIVGYNHACIAEIVKSLPPVAPKQKWIPVSERLPEEYQGVLICGEDIVRCAQLIGGLFECDDMDLYGSIDGTTVDGAETFEVVAWMPLPTPWKGESE